MIGSPGSGMQTGEIGNFPDWKPFVFEFGLWFELETHGQAMTLETSSSWGSRLLVGGTEVPGPWRLYALDGKLVASSNIVDLIVTDLKVAAAAAASSWKGFTSVMDDVAKTQKALYEKMVLGKPFDW